MAAGAESTRSSLTSVFHDLLGDGKAKEVAEQDRLVRATRDIGTPFISRQQRETSRDEVKRFSVMYYRRLEEDDALEALRSWSGHSLDLEMRLAAAMHARVPMWHVVVDSVDRPGHQITVSKYFMQNLEELKDLVRECLVEFLTDDTPGELEQAASNPQFQDWCRQWYHQSEDLNDTRSVRYICRLPGCAVLLHCVRNNFGECCRLLLDRFSNITASQRWLVLAEPMRYFGRYQANAFHEAAYCGALDCLEVLIDYGNRHKLDWKHEIDSNGETALDIAKSQADKGKAGAKECFYRLQREYDQRVCDQLVDPDMELLRGNVLVVDFEDSGESAATRRRWVLPSECICWADLVSVTKEAVKQLPQQADKLLVMVCKVEVEDSDEQAIHDFFKMWSHATSIGFPKCRFVGKGVAVSVATAIADQLGSSQPPAWQRLYIFEAMAAVKLSTEKSPGDIAEGKGAYYQAFALTLQRLCGILARNPLLPLWRLDHVRASTLPDDQRHVAVLVGVALDVKQCVHQLQSEKRPYRYFWSRLVHAERRMLDRMKLLSDGNCIHAQYALDPAAASYLIDCAKLWDSSLRGGESDNIDFFVERGVLTVEQHASLLAEIDSALAGMLLMCKAMPSLPSALMEALPCRLLERLPATTQILNSVDCQRAALQVFNTLQTHARGDGLSDGVAKGKGKKGSEGRSTAGGASSKASLTSSWSIGQRLAPSWQTQQGSKSGSTKASASGGLREAK